MNQNNYYKKYKIVKDHSYNLKGGSSQVIDEKEEGNLEIDNSQFEYQNRMSLYNPSKLPYMKPSYTTEYTIPEGTILYHGTMTRESFNPFDIRLGDDNLVAYLSPSKRFAASYIVGCAIYPNKNGFIHKFRVKQSITDILILSTFEKKKQWNLKFIEDSFCSRKYRIQLNGIGFFYPKADDIEFDKELDVNNVSVEGQSFDSEFAICNPQQFLEYVSTQRCVASRKLSDQYRFNQ